MADVMNEVVKERDRLRKAGEEVVSAWMAPGALAIYPKIQALQAALSITPQPEQELEEFHQALRLRDAQAYRSKINNVKAERNTLIGENKRLHEFVERFLAIQIHQGDMNGLWSLQHDIRAALSAQPQPVPKELHCPHCKTAHIDKDEWATKPHKTHLCSKCKGAWKPFEYPTVGVAEQTEQETIVHQPYIKHKAAWDGHKMVSTYTCAQCEAKATDPLEIDHKKKCEFEGDECLRRVGC